MKAIKYILILIGIVLFICGFIRDYDLFISLGAFLFVTGLMLKSIVEIFTGQNK